MLIPVPEYTTVSEMRRHQMMIRRAFRTYQRPVPDPLPEPEPVIFHMTMATPPNPIPPYPIWRRTTVRDVMNVVCEVWGVELMDLVSARRTHNVMRPRHAAYALACKFTSKSLPEIGRLMGGRDHTTVLCGRHKMQPLMDSLRDRLPSGAGLRQWAEELRREMTTPPQNMPHSAPASAISNAVEDCTSVPCHVERQPAPRPCQTAQSNLSDRFR